MALATKNLGGKSAKGGTVRTRRLLQTLRSENHEWREGRQGLYESKPSVV